MVFEGQGYFPSSAFCVGLHRIHRTEIRGPSYGFWRKKPTIRRKKETSNRRSNGDNTNLSPKECGLGYTGEAEVYCLPSGRVVSTREYMLFKWLVMDSHRWTSVSA